MASEKLLERNLTDTIKDGGGLCLKLLSPFVTGFPDRTILLPGGRIYFAEIKTTGKKPDKRQEFMHRLLRGLGFTVFLIDSKESLSESLKIMGL